MVLGKEKSDDFSKLENELEMLMEEQKGKVEEEKEEVKHIEKLKTKLIKWKSL